MPGAWITLDGKQTRVFGSKIWHGSKPTGAEVSIEGSPAPGIVHSEGLLISGSDGRHINVKLLNVEGKFIQVKSMTPSYRKTLLRCTIVSRWIVRYLSLT